MPNPRDTGGNVKIDFVWGNMPMQPDDDRGEDTLDPELDNHIIAVAEYNGFPGYTPVPPFTDNVENGTVPNVVGLTESAANSALVAVGLVKGAVTSTTDGATTVNDAKVKTQSVAAGTVVNEGTAVALTLFDYVAPPAGFVSADATLTSVSVLTFGSPLGWAFSKTGHTVAVGDWVRASGYYVIDETGNRTPSGSININGDWEIDAVNGDYFSSVALRAEIGALAGFNSSSFDSGTVLVDNQ